MKILYVSAASVMTSLYERRAEGTIKKGVSSIWRFLMLLFGRNCRDCVLFIINFYLFLFAVSVNDEREM